jgi:hypothetical protein
MCQSALPVHTLLPGRHPIPLTKPAVVRWLIAIGGAVVLIAILKLLKIFK